MPFSANPASFSTSFASSTSFTEVASESIESFLSCSPIVQRTSTWKSKGGYEEMALHSRVEARRGSLRGHGDDTYTHTAYERRDIHNSERDEVPRAWVSSSV